MKFPNRKKQRVVVLELNSANICVYNVIIYLASVSYFLDVKPGICDKGRKVIREKGNFFKRKKSFSSVSVMSLDISFFFF